MRRFLQRLYLGVIFSAWAAVAHAGRFLATPTASTLAEGRYSLYGIELYEKRSTKDWRGMNRLDLGLAGRTELGLFVISPKNKAPTTWINLQYQILKSKNYLPAFSAGVWDAASRGPWFDSLKIGPSPFVVAEYELKLGPRYAKGAVGYGSNRLSGWFGGAEIRFLRQAGILAEYAPQNLRLVEASAWDFGIYYWIAKSWRARASWMGGNPMMDVFLTHSFI